MDLVLLYVNEVLYYKYFMQISCSLDQQSTTN